MTQKKEDKEREKREDMMFKFASDKDSFIILIALNFPFFKWL